GRGVHERDRLAVRAPDLGCDLAVRRPAVAAGPASRGRVVQADRAVGMELHGNGAPIELMPARDAGPRVLALEHRPCVVCRGAHRSPSRGRANVFPDPADCTTAMATPPEPETAAIARA